MVLRVYNDSVMIRTKRELSKAKSQLGLGELSLITRRQNSEDSWVVAKVILFCRVLL
jgi:hypothetical protein